MKNTRLADNRFADMHLGEDKEAANIRKIHGRRCKPRTISALDVAEFAKIINELASSGPNVAAVPGVSGKHGG